MPAQREEELGSSRVVCTLVGSTAASLQSRRPCPALGGSMSSTQGSFAAMSLFIFSLFFFFVFKTCFFSFFFVLFLAAAAAAAAAAAVVAASLVFLTSERITSQSPHF